MNKIKLDDITKKYPFIYKIRDEYYIIGCGVFAVCESQPAISHFKRYREEIAKLGREYIQEQHYDNTSEIEELVYSFRKVKAYADIDIPNEEKTMSKRNTLEFLDNLNYSEKNSLLEQVEDYVASFWYYSRAF